VSIGRVCGVRLCGGQEWPHGIDNAGCVSIPQGLDIRRYTNMCSMSMDRFHERVLAETKTC
jgi:hypothetical protein